MERLNGKNNRLIATLHLSLLMGDEFAKISLGYTLRSMYDLDLRTYAALFYSF